MVILLIVFVQIVGASMVLPILPIYATRRFDMSFETVTLLNAVFFAAQFLAGPFIGRLSDHYGRVPVLIVSQIGTVLSFLMIGFAQSVALLFFARILDGITGGNIIVARAYVADITPREQRTQALGYIFVAFGVGFIFGPALGGILANLFGYTIPFVIAAIAAAIVVILTWTTLDESLSPEEREANRDKNTSKMDVRSVVNNMPLMSILVLVFGSQFAFAMLQSTFALYGEVVLFADNPDMVELGVGLLLGTMGIGQILTQLIFVGRLVDRWGEPALPFVGGIVRSVSMFVLVLVATPFGAGVTLFLFAVGVGIQMPALQSLITNTVPDNQRGGVMGLYQSSFSLGVIVGSAISGTLFALNPGVPYLVGGIIFALMLVPTYFIMRWAQNEERRSFVLQTVPAGD